MLTFDFAPSRSNRRDAQRVVPFSDAKTVCVADAEARNYSSAGLFSDVADIIDFGVDANADVDEGYIVRAANRPGIVFNVSSAPRVFSGTWHRAAQSALQVAATAGAMTVLTPIQVVADSQLLPIIRWSSTNQVLAPEPTLQQQLVEQIRELELRCSEGMKSAFTDARNFALAMPAGLPKPSVWTDGQMEVVFEWRGQRDHAIVSCEGDGMIGYTMRLAGVFESGADLDPEADRFPADLHRYLQNLK